jgi:hypothetical protein
MILERRWAGINKGMDNAIFIREAASNIQKQTQADLGVNYDLAILEPQMIDND